ncbi:hypothetical protein MHU86_8607 [Fragilaria crotonensis]|nr:hypothetical protein MHU86_8607 [Fragilaria crotonensis]
MITDGTINFFYSRTPTNHELGTRPHIVLTSPAEWNPRDVQFSSNAYRGEGGTYQISQIEVSARDVFDMAIQHNFDDRSISCVLTDRLLATANINGDADGDERPDGIQG